MLRPILIISLIACSVAAQAAEAGRVIFAAGAAQVADKAGAEGTPVQEGELLTTGKDGFLYVKTVDNGLFILRPNTKAKIVLYKVDKDNPANTHVKLELISGTARSKSGDAVKLARQNFRFNTPVAAIGVRGTDFTVYTDQETSRVAVLTGGVVVSGFAGACSPEGGGPCEGAASRELFAAQRGQLLEVTRGQVMPRVLESGGSATELLAPPRADEPIVKTGAALTPPVLEVRRDESFGKFIATVPPPKEPGKPPIVAVPELPKPETEAPQTERLIEWGRWAAAAGKKPTLALEERAGDRIILGDYVIYRSAGKEYLIPERGGVSFVLRNSEAYVRNENNESAATLAQVSNGRLDVDFGSATFSTSFDLSSDGQSYRMMADGSVAKDGRFGNSGFPNPGTNNMNVSGALGSENGGSAAYIFRGRVGEGRVANGALLWGR